LGIASPRCERLFMPDKSDNYGLSFVGQGFIRRQKAGRT
jgi:hypothetical protein